MSTTTHSHKNRNWSFFSDAGKGEHTAQSDLNSRGSSLDLGLLKLRSQQAQSHSVSEQVSERRKCLKRSAAELVDRSDELARMVAAHRHCTQAEALATELIPLLDAAKFLTKNATRLLAPKRLGTSGRPSWLTGVESEVHRQPLGLILVIAPGNYPLYLAGVQVLQALAAGNAVWIKPAPGALELMLSFREALIRGGFSPDLIQVLPESAEAARAAIDAGVDKVVFTGSAETGRKILAQLAPRLTPAIMELSGCDAVFLRTDADVNLAAKAIRFGLTLNRGATCIAPRRIFVPRQLLGDFTRALCKELKSADPIRLGVDGTKRWLPWVKEAMAEGAFVVSGTVHADHATAPLVLSATQPEMKVLRDDTFAPVACIVTVDSDKEALAANSQCPFALSASVFGRDPKSARRFADQIRAGSVIVNDLIAPTADPRLPFGGVGQSGFGVTRGAEGLLEMTTPKVVISNRSRVRMHYKPFREADAPLFQSLLQLCHGRSLGQRFRALLKTISAVRNQPRTPR